MSDHPANQEPPVPAGYVRRSDGAIFPAAFIGERPPVNAAPKLLIVLNYYAGDAERVGKLACLIADLEPTMNEEADVLLWGRFDVAGFPNEGIDRLRAKFRKVTMAKSNRQGAVGYPYGANEMWHALVQEMALPKWRDHYFAFLNMEWDAVPTRAGWLGELIAAFKQAKKVGKAAVGVVQPSHGIPHMNGVALYDTNLANLTPNNSLLGCSPSMAYDMAHAGIMLPLCEHTPLIRLDWKKKTVTAEEVYAPNVEGEPAPCLYHGVQDDSCVASVRVGQRDLKPIFITYHDANFNDLFFNVWHPGFHRHIAPSVRHVDMAVNGIFGNFGDTPYNLSYADQIRRVLTLLVNHPDRVFIWSDCDMAIYGNFMPELLVMANKPGFEMATQMDRSGDDPIHCAGFIVMRSTAKVRAFFTAWLAMPPAVGMTSHQDTFNVIAKEIKMVQQLGAHFWTAGLSPDLQKCPWEPGDAVPQPPDNIVLHHANFCQGKVNKACLLESVKNMHGLKRGVMA